MRFFRLQALNRYPAERADMKYEYRFADEAVSIEVSDEWSSILIDLDRQEYNNDHKETRRHYHLDACAYEGDDFAVDDPRLAALFDDGYIERLPMGISQLQPQQRELLRRVFFNGERPADIARESGVSKAAISDRLQKIYVSLRKKLSEGA